MNDYFFQLSLADAEHFIMDCVARALTQGGQAPPSRSPASPEQLLRIADVCQMLSISRPTCYEWMKTGRLPHYRKGRNVYFKQAEVLASLERPKRNAYK